MKNILVKLGGSVITDDAYRLSIIQQLVEIIRNGHNVTIVHGGGKLISYYLDRLGIKSEFHEGLRVTPQEALDVVMMTLIGKVNKDIVRDFNSLGIKAVGLSGGDGNLVTCQKLTLEDGYDLGQVGVPSGVNVEFYEELVKLGYAIVIATIGSGEEGYYNINADHTAAFVAQEVKADHLIYVSDVDGVLHPETKELFANLTPDMILNLKNKGIIMAGMLPKLHSCVEALENGVKRVSILNGKKQKAICDAVMLDKAPGTEIVLN